MKTNFFHFVCRWKKIILYFIGIDFGAVQGLFSAKGNCRVFDSRKLPWFTGGYTLKSCHFTTRQCEPTRNETLFFVTDQYSNGFNVCLIIDEAQSAPGPFLSGRMFVVLKCIWIAGWSARLHLKYSCVGLERSRREKKETRKKKQTNELELFGASKYHRNESPHNTATRMTERRRNKTERENRKQLCEVKATTGKLTSPSLDDAMMRRWCLQKSTRGVRENFSFRLHAAGGAPRCECTAEARASSLYF